MSFYSAIARPLLFRLPPETAHEVTMHMLSMAGAVFGRCVPAPGGKRVHCLGMDFPNAIGLAAGMDKNAIALPAWPLLGFGFVEIGTITAHAQPGNPKPRLFRLPKQKALINRMGFNNEGAERVAARLDRWKTSGRWPRVPVGINLGKSRITALEDAPSDYAESFRCLQSYGDYFAVNVSSPNTPGLRQLQAADHLREILRAIRKENTAGKPVLVKIAPDLADDDIASVVAAGEEEGAAGWIATNTTIDHHAVPAGEDQEGGLSGEPLRQRSTDVIRKVAAAASRPVIGVGGISDVESAREKVEAGAKLLQIYSALVYEGPMLPRRLARCLQA
ncbi:MAG: quinone-dependent dihydroorotate dehydrogenase [Chthoniobacterales bacterium]|nr:quinone-dependent dihydroorotate dehydrogenase [Chthoniobacterales bacterium]